MIAWCSMLHSLTFDMQHDNVLKKFNFELFTHLQGERMRSVGVTMFGYS